MSPPFDAAKLDRLLDEAWGLEVFPLWTYDGVHAQRPLEAGKVLSIETGIKHPEVGFIKLEDTVAVTERAWEAYGDWGRDWNVVQP